MLVDHLAFPLAALTIGSISFVVIRLERRVARLKVRGLSASAQDLEAMSDGELKAIRDLLEPDMRDRTKQEREQFQLIEDAFRTRRPGQNVVHHRLEDH